MCEKEFWSFMFLYAVCMVCVWFLFSVNAMRTRKLSKVTDAKLEQLHEDISNEIDVRFGEKSLEFMTGVKQYVYEAIENAKWTEEAQGVTQNGTNYLNSSILAN